MAFCIECGSKLPDNAKFCLECGTAVALKVETTKKEDSSPALKFQFQEQEAPKYKEVTDDSVVIPTPVPSPTTTTINESENTSAEEEYFDDDDSIELFDETEEKPTSDLLTVDADLPEAANTGHAVSTVTDEINDRDNGNYIAEQAKKYFEGLSAADDYALTQGMDRSDINPDTMAPILNPISDPYFDDVLPEIEEELNKADKTLLVKPAIILTLIILFVIWFIYML